MGIGHAPRSIVGVMLSVAIGFGSGACGGDDVASDGTVPERVETTSTTEHARSTTSTSRATTTTTAAPTTTTTAPPTTTTTPPTTAPPTTAAPPPQIAPPATEPPPPPTAAAPDPAPACHPNYSGCLDPNASDYDCEGGSGNGPLYTGTVEVHGADPFDLDRNHDGIGCEDS